MPTPTKTPDANTTPENNGSFGIKDVGDLGVSPTSNTSTNSAGQNVRGVGANSSNTSSSGLTSAAKSQAGIPEGDTMGEKAHSAYRDAVKKAGAAGGEGGGSTGGASATGGKMKPSTASNNPTGNKLGQMPEGPVLKSDKEAENRKGDWEKDADVTLEAGMNYVAPGSGIVLEKLGGIRGTLKKAGLTLLVSIAIISIPAFMIGYILNNPFSAIREVLTNSSLRGFGLDVARAFGENTLARSIEALTYTGEVDYHGPNTAIAATQSQVTPGTTLEKLTQIDWKKAQYQTLDKNDCGFKLNFRQVVNVQGTVRNVPENVENTRTKKIIPLNQLNNNLAASYCIQKQYPVFNMMARQPVTREINSIASVYLNYASPKDSEELKGDQKEVKKFVYDKTIVRVTPNKNDTIDFTPYQDSLNKINQVYKEAVKRWNSNPSNEQIPISETNTNITEGINKMYDDMKAGTSPYELNITDYINVPTKVTQNDTGIYGQGLAATLCPFVYGFMSTGYNPNDTVGAENARRAIESRLASTQRGAVKIATLDDTRKANELSNKESSATIVQSDNWASSTAYQLDVYNQLRGVQMNPEATATRAYNVRQNNDDIKGAVGGMYAACTLIGLDSNIQSINNSLETTGAQLFLSSYNVLKQQIKNDSPGVFSSTDDFGTEQIMTAFMRTGSATAVSGLEPGPDNYNRQAAGFRQLMNDYYLKIGGRFLNAQEAKEVALENESMRRSEEQQRGIAYRLFDSTNIRSARSIIAQNTVTPKTAMTASGGLLKNILDPLRSLASIHSSLLYYVLGQHNTAYAADITTNEYLKIDTAGIPQQDFNINMLENANVIENIKNNGSEADKAKITNYDACMAAKIPTSQYFTIRDFTNANGVRFKYFEFFPEKRIKVDAAGNALTDQGDNTDKATEFNKFADCKMLLFDATDFSRSEQQLAIRYRIYKYYNTILDMLVSLSSNQENPSIYAGSSGSQSNTSLSQDAKELAKQILNDPNIVFDSDRIKDSMIKASLGEPSPTTCGNAGVTLAQLDIRLLQAIIEVSKQGIPLRISSLTTGCHTNGSDHYKGQAVDIGNADEGDVGDRIQTFLQTNKDRLGIDQILWKVPDHFNHLHFSTVD